MRGYPIMARYILQLASRHHPHYVPAATYYGTSRIGNRDLVGYGINSSAVYLDKEMLPMPAIRFKENTPDVVALREKEKGDWKKLSLEEKKQLYRASFCLTYAEMGAPTGKWKQVIGMLCVGISVSLWISIFMKQFVLPPLPDSFLPENMEFQLNRMIDLRVNPIDGLTSKWDYENMKWKD